MGVGEQCFAVSLSLALRPQHWLNVAHGVATRNSKSSELADSAGVVEGTPKTATAPKAESATVGAEPCTIISWKPRKVARRRGLSTDADVR